MGNSLLSKEQSRKTVDIIGSANAIAETRKKFPRAICVVGKQKVADV